jgi:type IV pilus assembly protein PilB
MAELDELTIEPAVLGLIPKNMAMELSVLPLRVNGDAVVVALAENYSPQVVGDLAFLMGKRVVAETFEAGVLARALRKHYGVSDMDSHRHSVSGTPEFLSAREKPLQEETSGDGSVVALVNRIISDAIRMGASDVHVEPYERMLRIRFRMDGVLHEILRPPVAQAKPLISRLKIMADLDIAEKRRPQDGRIRVKEGERVIDIRVSSLPTDFGEKIVLRILDKSHLQLDLTKLGLEERDLQVLEKTIRLPYGMILVTGPTGSGKTTTLYAALNSINRPDINITTIEDPIEYNLPGINQTHVRADIGVTFAAALRSILRQDPNVIMVGEIRDGETAEIAIRAALTGHLVFSTLHTNDAPSAITRLIDMGVEPFLIASSLRLILAQRLLRSLCRDCRRDDSQTEGEMKPFGLSMNRHQFFKPGGCVKCHHTGYSGRSAVYEFIRMDERITEVITRGGTSGEVRAMAGENGFSPLRVAALKRAAYGVTSLDEVIRET